MTFKIHIHINIIFNLACVFIFPVFKIYYLFLYAVFIYIFCLKQKKKKNYKKNVYDLHKIIDFARFLPNFYFKKIQLYFYYICFNLKQL